ncbi:hypothetical protein OH779_11985 [Actinacidiphila glaucinigra]|uniref:hypothetical protein n=1 Tax=Actinacidiphila glaucinigra TaxID=235986 RepID=UPI003864DAB8
MPQLPDAVMWSIPAFVLLTVVELISYRIHPDEGAAGYAAKDTATSLSMGLGSLFFDFRPVFGLTKNITTFNPLRVATHEYAAIARDVAAARTWRDRAGHVLRGPGWRPRGEEPAA